MNAILAHGVVKKNYKHCHILCAYLLKSRWAKTTWNQPKWAETSRNNPKPAKRTQKNYEMTQNFKFGEIWNFLLSFVFQSLSPNAQIWAFGPKSINFLVLMKFCIHPILYVLISNLSFVFEYLEPKFPNLGILDQKLLTF